MPESREDTLRRIRAIRESIATIQLDESRGHQKTASDRNYDKIIVGEAELLLKEAFALGPAGRACPLCGGSGRA